jgi:hypothetical protein
MAQSRAARVGSGLTRKHYTRLEIPAMDKQSSLMRTLVIYDHKKVLQQCGQREVLMVLYSVSFLALGHSAL